GDRLVPALPRRKRNRTGDRGSLLPAWCPHCEGVRLVDGSGSRVESFRSSGVLGSEIFAPGTDRDSDVQRLSHGSTMAGTPAPLGNESDLHVDSGWPVAA